MAGLKCANEHCGYMMGGIPERDIRYLRMPSSTITCPRCDKEQPAADAWVAYENWQEEQRKGGKVFFYHTAPSHTAGGRKNSGLVIARR